MRARRVGVALIALALASLGAWWVWPEVEAAGAPDGGAERHDMLGHAGPSAPGREAPRALGGSDGGRWKLTGVVLDEQGAPVQGATVKAFIAAELLLGDRACGACGRRVVWCGAPASVREVLSTLRSGAVAVAPTAEATTDAEGRFSFDGLEPAALRLTALEGGRAGSIDVDEVPAEGAQAEITLRASRTRTLELQAEDRSPVGAVDVVLFGLSTGELRLVRTDGSGRASWALPDEQVWVGVDVPGWLPVGQVVSDDAVVMLLRPKTLVVRTVMSGRPIDVDVEVDLHGVERRRSQAGEARFDDLGEFEGYVRAFNGELSSERVYVLLENARTELTLELRRAAILEVTVVDPSGKEIEDPWLDLAGPSTLTGLLPDEDSARPRFSGVPEGEYTLEAQAEGFQQVRQQIDLAPGLNRVTVVLQPSGMIRGVVVDEHDQPVGGAVVELDADATGELNEAQSDGEGRFELEVVDFSGTRLRAWSPEAGSGTAVGRPGEEVRLKLRPGATLEIEIIDVDGRHESENVMLEHVESGVRRFVMAAAPFGRCAGLAPGTWNLTLDRAERLPIAQKVTLAPEQVQRVTLHLRMGEEIEGRVLEADGRPTEGAQLVSGGPGSVRTDAQGRFLLRGVPPGPVNVLVVSPDGERTFSAEVTAPARGVELRFEQLVRISGQVVDESGSPVPEFRIERKDVSHPQGRFEVALPTGSAYLFADGFFPRSIKIEREGDLGALTMRRLPTLTGEVVADGRPVPGAQVTVVETLEETTTDAEGRFTLSLGTELTDSDDEVHLIASRGSNSARVAARPGLPVRITLARGTRVSGRVVDGTGAPVRTQVELSLQDEVRALSVSTDALGRFEVTLPPGSWTMTPRGGAPRVFPIFGERQEITIVDPRTCQVVLEAPEADAAWLAQPGAPEQGDWLTGEGVPSGTISLPLDLPGGTWAPCGRFELLTMENGHVRRQAVNLEPGRTVLRAARAAVPE
ncbi:MAG: carboxypeptidase-like regulatory domain-containing protein [Myxococcota bacterium]